MPELPEVEHLRRSLDPLVLGASVMSVSIRRRDVIHLPARAQRTSRFLEESLGVGAKIVRSHRHGKQLALEFSNGRILVVQLGMTGGVSVEPPPDSTSTSPESSVARHRHVLWNLQRLTASPRGRQTDRGSNGRTFVMAFHDPRRFGGLTSYSSMTELRAFWRQLGPDALTIDAEALALAFETTSRCVKTVLLDQSKIAGVGNIYADEALFAARIHPLSPAHAVPSKAVAALARCIRRILERAIEHRGSTLRNYRDADGNAGTATSTHLVYGRGGKPCTSCRQSLMGTKLGGRTTVYCEGCQHLSTICAT